MSSPNRDNNNGKVPAGLTRGVAFVGERLIAVALGLLLLRSAFAHLGNPYYFLSTVYSYQLTGIAVGKWAAMVLPYLQMVVAVCLLARWWAKEAYLLTFVLFVGFTAAQALALRQGLEISCGCFGASGGLQIGRVSLTVAGSAALASVFGWGLVVVRERKAGVPPCGGSIPCAATPDAQPLH